VQRVHFPVEAGLVERFSASRLPSGCLGLHARIGNIRVRPQQIMQVGDQELQQVCFVEVGDKGQLNSLAESRLAHIKNFPAAVIEQLRHQPAKREDRSRRRRRQRHMHRRVRR